MPRRLTSKATKPKPVSTAVDRKQADIESFVGPPDKRKKGRSKPGAQRRADYIEDVRRRIKASNWRSMKPSLLVALYFVCHEQVYGVEPVELTKSTTWEKATMSAGRMVKEQFEGDADEAVPFLRWVWTRERDIEDWRRKNRKHGRRISWINQFVHGHLLSDWRAAKVRHG